MNKKYKKMLATGLALNMMLINIPYNVFANSDMIENIILSEDDIPLIGEQNESGLHSLVNQDEQTLNDKDLILNDGEESDSSYIINNETTSELLKPTTEDYSIILENNTNENMLNSIIDFTEDKKTAKSTIPNIVNYADSFAGGNGTEESPYQISNALELARLAYLVNEEDLDTTDIYFELINDIDLNDFDSDNDSSNGNWTPIGYTTGRPDYIRRSFKGVLNGNNHNILNMHINTNLTSVGLFGCTNNATIKNISLKNVSVIGGYNISSFIGYAEQGTNLSCINVEIDTIKMGDTSSSNIGGLIGYSISKSSEILIENSTITFKNKVENTNAYSLGGVIGSHTGGIVVTDCSIKGDLTSMSNLGGLVGCYNNYDSSDIINFSNVSIESNLSSEYNNSQIGGFVGYLYHSGLNKNIEINNINFKGSIVGGDMGQSGGLAGYFAVSNQADSSIEISNCNIELVDLKSYRVGGLIGLYYPNSSVSNIKDININIKGDVRAIDCFGGLIGNSGSGSDLNVENYNLNIEKPINAYSYVGGVAGNYSGNIYTNNVNIDYNVISSKGTEFSFQGYIGGLVGYLYSTDSSINSTRVSMNVESIEDYPTNIGGFLGAVTGSGKGPGFHISNSYHIGDLSGQNIGGLVGIDFSLTNVIITNFYSVGNKTATDLLGGIFGKRQNYLNLPVDLTINNFYIAGHMHNITSQKDLITYIDKDKINTSIKNAYYDSTIINIEDTNFIGLATEQMQGYSTYDNMDFDFNNIWKANRDYYPTFEQLNTAPELSGSDIELILNQNYNLLDYVTVEDFEDKNLNIEIKETNLDITKIGDYTATFTVVDPKGLTDELTLNIKVVAEKPIINAKDLTLYIGDKFNPLDKVTAIDINGNDITEHIKVIENTVDTTKKGVYKVVYQVDSLERLTTTKEIKVTVLEKEIGNNNNNKVESDKNESSTTDKPQTGDNFIVYEISLLTCLIGLLYINRKSKKED